MYIADHRDKFGSVFTLHLGTPVVILNSAAAVHETFVKKADSFSNRPLRFNTPFKQLGIYGRELFINFILYKLYVSELEAANKKIANSETEIRTLKRDVETLTEEKIELSEGNY